MLIQEKVNQAVELLRELDLPCWLTFVRETVINGDPSLAFLVDHELTWPSAIVITASGDTRAIVGQYDKAAVQDLGVYGEVEGYVQGIKEPLTRYLTSLDPARIGVNYSKDSEACDGLTHGMFLRLEEYLSDSGLAERLVSAEALVSALRQRKTPTEIARIREAIRRTEQIFAEVAAFLAPGKTERDVATFVREQVERARLDYAWDPHVCPSFFTGPDTAGAHYGPTDRRIERGHVANMDFGVKTDGYCADLQRTFYVLEDGQPAAPAEVAAGFDAIVACIEASRQALRPGVQGRDVDAVSRRVLAERGYEEFPHALGHQVGRYAHDGTALLGPMWEKYGARPLAPIEEGMVFTIEPRLTVPGRGVVTIEEMVRVTSDGAEYLSTPQKTLYLVGGPVRRSLM